MTPFEIIWNSILKGMFDNHRVIIYLQYNIYYSCLLMIDATLVLLERSK